MAKLVELMKIYPDIGRGKLPLGHNKIQLKDTWDHFTEQLNGFGQLIRNIKEKEIELLLKNKTPVDHSDLNI